jgi:hypothetical protein
MAQTTNRKLPRFVLVLVTTFCSLLIAACGSLETAKSAVRPCNQGVCKVDVAVVACVIANIPNIAVPRAPNNIEWTIQTPGYSFPENGIVIDPAAASDFSLNPGVTGSGKKFILHDKHNILSPPSIKYTVRVVNSNGVACAPYDPFIDNL